MGVLYVQYSTALSAVQVLPLPCEWSVYATHQGAGIPPTPGRPCYPAQVASPAAQRLTPWSETALQSVLMQAAAARWPIGVPACPARAGTLIRVRHNTIHAAQPEFLQTVMLMAVSGGYDVVSVAVVVAAMTVAAGCVIVLLQVTCPRSSGDP